VQGMGVYSEKDLPGLQQTPSRLLLPSVHERPLV
jgi:hypothetical protein